MKYMPFIWLTVVVISMLIGAAHADLPACQYDDPNGSGEWELRSYKEPGTVALPDGGCVVWHCDAGHKWKAEGFCFSAADMAHYSGDTVRSWIGMTKEERNLLWANNVRPAAPGSIDERMIKWRDTLPKPAKVPPSGLVTTSTKAYRMNRIANNTPTFTLVGTVALGVPCAPENLNGYHRIDVALVKVPAKVLKPLEAFATCDNY